MQNNIPPAEGAGSPAPVAAASWPWNVCHTDSSLTAEEAGDLVSRMVSALFPPDVSDPFLACFRDGEPTDRYAARCGVTEKDIRHSLRTGRIFFIRRSVKRFLRLGPEGYVRDTIRQRKYSVREGDIPHLAKPVWELDLPEKTVLRLGRADVFTVLDLLFITTRDCLKIPCPLRKSLLQAAAPFRSLCPNLPEPPSHQNEPPSHQKFVPVVTPHLCWPDNLYNEVYPGSRLPGEQKAQTLEALIDVCSTDETRPAVLLRYREGLDFDAIARRLGTTRESVKEQPYPVLVALRAPAMMYYLERGYLAVQSERAKMAGVPERDLPSVLKTVRELAIGPFSRVRLREAGIVSQLDLLLVLAGRWEGNLPDVSSASLLRAASKHGLLNLAASWGLEISSHRLSLRERRLLQQPISGFPFLPETQEALRTAGAATLDDVADLLSGVKHASITEKCYPDMVRVVNLFDLRPALTASGRFIPDSDVFPTSRSTTAFVTWQSRLFRDLLGGKSLQLLGEETDSTVEKLSRALLTPVQRDVILAMWRDGKSVSQIAAERGVRPAQVNYRRKAALTTLSSPKVLPVLQRGLQTWMRDRIAQENLTVPEEDLPVLAQTLFDAGMSEIHCHQLGRRGIFTVLDLLLFLAGRWDTVDQAGMPGMRTMYKFIRDNGFQYRCPDLGLQIFPESNTGRLSCEEARNRIAEENLTVPDEDLPVLAQTLLDAGMSEKRACKFADRGILTVLDLLLFLAGRRDAVDQEGMPDMYTVYLFISDNGFLRRCPGWGLEIFPLSRATACSARRLPYQEIRGRIAEENLTVPEEDLSVLALPLSIAGMPEKRACTLADRGILTVLDLLLLLAGRWDAVDQAGMPGVRTLYRFINYRGFLCRCPDWGLEIFPESKVTTCNARSLVYQAITESGPFRGPFDSPSEELLLHLRRPHPSFSGLTFHRAGLHTPGDALRLLCGASPADGTAPSVHVLYRAFMRTGLEEACSMCGWIVPDPCTMPTYSERQYLWLRGSHPPLP